MNRTRLKGKMRTVNITFNHIQHENSIELRLDLILQPSNDETGGNDDDDDETITQV